MSHICNSYCDTDHSYETEKKQSWDVQYYSISLGGWVLFKEYDDEEKALDVAIVLNEGFQRVRVVDIDNHVTWER